MVANAPGLTYDDVVRASIAACWQIEDVFPKNTRISFERPHLPDALADVAGIECLDDSERLRFNHIRGLSYMNLFAFVEEYIIAQTVRHAEAEMFGDHAALRALMRFGEEELKHQRLFQDYCAAFRRDFGVPCQLLESAAEVANIILARSPLAVMLTTLHLELMTQQHYLSSVKGHTNLDPLFSSILKHHWMEESQHAKIDMLEIHKMAKFADAETIDKALSDYFDIVAAFDGVLMQQVEMDLASLQLAIRRQLEEPARDEIRIVQQRSYRRDFIEMGMTNSRFRKTIAALHKDALVRLDTTIENHR